jgi:hypothetical protein
MSKLIADEGSAMLRQVKELEEKIAQVEKQLSRLMKDSRPCQLLMSVPGVGLMTTTALAAANCSGRLWRAPCNDRHRRDAEIHVGTGSSNTEAQLDAGYTTAGVSVLARQWISLLRWWGSPYTDSTIGLMR